MITIHPGGERMKSNNQHLKRRKKQPQPRNTTFHICNNSRSIRKPRKNDEKSLTQSQILYSFLGPETRQLINSRGVTEPINYVWILICLERTFLCQCIAKWNDFSSLPFTSQLYIPCKRVDLLRIRESTMEQHSRNQESNSVQQLQRSTKRFHPLKIRKLALTTVDWITHRLQDQRRV